MMRAKPAPLASNAEWEAWGKADPFWAVATEPGRQRGASLAWTGEEFYASGASDWCDFFSQWRQYGVNAESCLEIGCGAGRFTRQAASVFEVVHAVDVSPHMIAQARQGVAAENVVYHLTGGLELPLADASVHAIFSTHVLQHLDDAETVTAYFLEFFRVLRPGGSILIHVPLYEWPGVGRIAALLRGIHRLLLNISQAWAWMRRRTGRKLMRGTAVNTRSLYSALATMGFREVEFRTFSTSRNGTLHSCVMAKK